jgi:hypothetical protein
MAGGRRHVVHATVVQNFYLNTCISPKKQRNFRCLIGSLLNREGKASYADLWRVAKTFFCGHAVFSENIVQLLLCGNAPVVALRKAFR